MKIFTLASMAAGTMGEDELESRFFNKHRDQMSGMVAPTDEWRAAPELYFNKNDWNRRAEATRLKCDGFDNINDKKLDQVKWFRNVVGNRPGYNQIYEDQKIADYKREGETFRNVAPTDGYIVDEATGDLLITADLKFDSLAVDVDGNILNGATNFAYSYMCEIDHGDTTVENDMVNHYGDIKKMLFLDFPEYDDMLFVTSETSEYIFTAKDTVTLAECRSGYATKEPEEEWVVHYEDGTDEILPNKGFAESGTFDTDEDNKQLEELKLQPTLSLKHDNARFSCHVTYTVANENREQDVKTKRIFWPEDDQRIRIIHPISELNIDLNGKSFSEERIAVDASETYTVAADANGVNANGPSIASCSKDQISNLKKDETIECQAGFGGDAELTKTFVLHPISMGELEVSVENDGRDGVDPIFITAKLDLDPKDEKLKYEIVDKKNKRHEVDPDSTETGPDGKHIANIKIGQGDAMPIAVRISAVDNGSINQQKEISGEVKALANHNADEELVCAFNQYRNNAAERIKFWYSNCDDEHGAWEATATEELEFDNNGEGVVKASVASGALKDGFYICCYDYANDVTATNEMDQRTCDNLFEDGENAFQDENTLIGDGRSGYFSNSENQHCQIHYISGVMAASFPWWVLLVIFIIVIIVLLAIYFYKKKKEKETESNKSSISEDPEKQTPAAAAPAKKDPTLWAGNVPGESPTTYITGADHIPDHIPDGQIEAKQEHSSETDKLINQKTA